MVLGRQHKCHCEEERGERVRGRGNEKGWWEKLGPSSPGEGPSKTAGSVSLRATGSMTKASTQQGQTAGGVLPRSLSLSNSESNSFHFPVFFPYHTV